MDAIAYCKDLGDRLLVFNANPAKRNVLSPEYYQVIKDAMQQASDEARICAVIMSAEGDFFCAGGDLRQLQARRESSREYRLERIEKLHDVIRSITQCTKPVVAAIEGGAAGAGVSIAFACDFMVASDTAAFTAAYVKAGLVPDGGLTHHLAQQIPRALLMRMTMLGEPVTAQRLFELGALAELVPAGAVMDKAMALVDQLADGPTATQSAIKQLVNQAADGVFKEQLSREREAMVDAIGSDEAAEGIASFLEKRKSDFARLRGK